MLKYKLLKMLIIIESDDIIESKENQNSMENIKSGGDNNDNI